MPNWSTNTLHIPKEHMDKVKKLLVNNKGEVDFNILKPMPEELGLTSGSLQRSAVKLATRFQSEPNAAKLAALGKGLQKEVERYEKDERYKEELKKYPTLWKLGRRYLENERLYGHQTWYEWCCEHWGTKWNAFEEDIGNDYIAFQTAWCPPTPILLLLSRELPDMEIELEADIECDGKTIIRLRNGKIIFEETVDWTCCEECSDCKYTDCCY